MVYFIPTPIGNLEDISLRSLNLLMRVSHIFCEDARVTKKLLSLLENRYNLKNQEKTYISFHSHNENEVIKTLNIEDLKQNEYAFVSDAGMPCVSDPGSSLVRFCQLHEVEYEIFSGANALLVTLASSGFYESEFSFFGFLPHKGKKRELKFQEVLNSSLNTILYEAPHRIELLSSELAQKCGERRVLFIKEISKKHEKKYFGTAKELHEVIKNVNQKGEWAVAIEKNPNPKNITPLTPDDILTLPIKPKQKAKLLAKLTGEKIEFWYKKLIS